MANELARALRRLASTTSTDASGSGVQVWVGPPGARVPYGDLAAMAAGEGGPDDLGALDVGGELLVAAEGEITAWVDDGDREHTVYEGPAPATARVDDAWPEIGVFIVRSEDGHATFTFSRRS